MNINWKHYGNCGVASLNKMVEMSIKTSYFSWNTELDHLTVHLGSIWHFWWQMLDRCSLKVTHIVFLSNKKPKNGSRCSIMTACCISLLNSAVLDYICSCTRNQKGMWQRRKLLETNVPAQTRTHNKSFIDMIMSLFCCTKSKQKMYTVKALSGNSQFLLTFTYIIHIICHWKWQKIPWNSLRESKISK